METLPFSVSHKRSFAFAIFNRSNRRPIVLRKFSKQFDRQKFKSLFDGLIAALYQTIFF